MNQIVALVPIKANSERVKGKNFRPLAGKPLYRWIVDTLLSVPAIDQVVINTDAKERFSETGLTESKRLLLRQRRPEICGDFVSMNRVLEDDIENVSSQYYLMTHATNPHLSAEVISKGIDLFLSNLKSGKCDSLFSVNKFQGRFYRGDGSAINHDPKNLIRTQDLEPWYLENSCLYLFTRESFMTTQARIGKKPFLYEIPLVDSVDIDDQETWNLAESLAYAKKG
ncbi:MAG: Cytidylyltransferase [Bacteriovoracaceae bacterium]|nr:Cytidylyltransferase [Bacteriovoracaceae bacterium]